MKKLSSNALSIEASVTLEISAKAKQLKAEGKDITAFTAGEPDFNTPDFILEKANQAMKLGLTKYTPTSGMLQLKQAIVEKFQTENNLSYALNQIVVSCGAKSSLYHALYAILNEGDEVIIPTPYWVTYVEQVKLCGGTNVIVQTQKSHDYKLTPVELENAITDKTKCLILNSPSNPSGVVYSQEELQALAKVIEKYDIFVISDEIYEHLVFDGYKHYSIASCSEKLYQNTIVVNGVSKTYSMTGWRVGYIACNKDIAKAVANVQGHTTSNACSISQYASIYALKDGNQFISNMNGIFDSRRKLITTLLDKVSQLDYIHPNGAFYVFVDISYAIGKSFCGNKINGSFDFSNILLDYGVAVVPGVAFGMDNFVRLSYAISDADIIKGINKMQEFLTKLN